MTYLAHIGLGRKRMLASTEHIKNINHFVVIKKSWPCYMEVSMTHYLKLKEFHVTRKPWAWGVLSVNNFNLMMSNNSNHLQPETIHDSLPRPYLEGHYRS